jgi:hypothetical protein
MDMEEDLLSNLLRTGYGGRSILGVVNIFLRLEER